MIVAVVVLRMREGIKNGILDWKIKSGSKFCLKRHPCWLKGLNNGASKAVLYHFILPGGLALPDFTGRCKCPVSKWRNSKESRSLLDKYQTIIGWDFCGIRNNQGRSKFYQPSRRPRLITLTETLISQDITKTESNNCFIIHYLEENNDKHTVGRNLNYDIVIGNHELLAQP